MQRSKKLLFERMESRISRSSTLMRWVAPRLGVWLLGEKGDARLLKERMQRISRAVVGPYKNDLAANVHGITSLADLPSERILRARKLVVLVHGGGFVMGEGDAYRGFAQHLANAFRAQVLLLDYPLAPENPFPAAYDATKRLLRDLAAEVSYRTQVILYGDSAGANLILACLASAPPFVRHRIQAVILLSPWVNLAEDLVLRSADVVVPSYLVKAREAYLGQTFVSARDPRVSPFFAGFPRLPPILIQSSSAEAFHQQIELMVIKLKQGSGTANLVTWQVWEHLPHVWSVLLPGTPEAVHALQMQVEWANSLE